MIGKLIPVKSSSVATKDYKNTMKNAIKLTVSGTALAAVGFITGCAPGDSTGKVAGETRLRSAHSSITGFNHNYTENNNSCIDLKISAEVLEAFSGIDPSLFGSGANARLANPPLAFDFSHQDHRGAQAMMWNRILSVTDRLATLLKGEVFDTVLAQVPAGTSFQALAW